MKIHRTVLILAAGRGKRLMPHTADKPKCLVSVGGHPILFWQLSALAACGVKGVVIVTGYRAPMIRKYVAENFPHIRVKFIHNSGYRNTGKLHSWHLAKKAAGGSHIALDSDIIFHPAIISLALSLPQETSAAIFIRRKCRKDETKVSVDKTEILDISKDIPPGKTSGKFTGIYVFSEDFSKHFFSAAGELLNSNSPHAFGFDVIRKIRDEKGIMLNGLDVSRHPFIEIDLPDDVRIAEAEVLPRVISALKRKQA